MKKLYLLAMMLLFLNQCKSSGLNYFFDKDVQKLILIGDPLKSVEQQEKELNLTFEFIILESLKYDINNDGIKDEINIEKIKDWEDPGDFHRIRIIISGKEFTFFNMDGWVKVGAYETQYLPSFIKTNQVDSKYIVVQKSSMNDIMLFAFGYVYASEAGLLSIINLQKFDEPKMIFNDNFSLYSLEDKNNDGTIDIVVTKYDKDELSNVDDLKTYLLINGYYQLLEK